MKSPFDRPGRPLIRVVLDTNILLSALLFEGPTNRLVDTWQNRRILPIMTRPIFDEYLRAFSYPKFQLTDREIRFLIDEQILPFFEVISEKPVGKIPSLRDSSDKKFLECALAGKAIYLITGDRELQEVKKIGFCNILSPSRFLNEVMSLP